MIDDITPLILTHNEAPNLERTLGSLTWARDAVVVDSGSTDGTRDILMRSPNVRVYERGFSSHAEQWNFALEQTGISTEWVLTLDADYVLSDDLTLELKSLQPGPEVSGYRAWFIYCIGGKPLRSGIYPPGVVLFRRKRGRYVQDGHTQRLVLEGRVEDLKGPIYHDDRKPLRAWLAAQMRYMRLESRRLLRTPASELRFSGRVRRLIFVAPVAVPFYCLVLRAGVLDGWAGLYYALQRALAEAILSGYLVRGYLGMDSDRAR